MTYVCNPPNPSAFSAWFRQAHIDSTLQRAARCGWNSGRKAGPMTLDDLDHSASIDAQGVPRPGAIEAFKAGWWASRHQLERQDAKGHPHSVAASNVREREQKKRMAKKYTAAAAKREAAIAKQEADRRTREMQSAARQSIWAIAEVDERARDQKTLDPTEAARRLRGVVSFDVDTLGGVVPAVKLYLKERNRVRVSMREEKKPRLVQGRIVKP